MFVAGSGGGIFYLRDGDTAVGNPGAKNIYYIYPSANGGEIANVNIINFGSNDQIMIWNDGWKAFSGYSALTVTEGFDDDHKGHDIGLATLSRTGTVYGNAWSIVNDKNVTGFADEFKNVTGKQANIEVDDKSNISYHYISDSSGIITLTQFDGSALANGLRLNIESATPDLGYTSNLSITERKTFLGVNNLGGAYDKEHAYSNKKTPLSEFNSEWDESSLYSSALPFYNKSIEAAGQAVNGTPPPSVTVSGDFGQSSSSGATPAPGLSATAPGQTLDTSGNYNVVSGQGGGDTFVYQQGYGLVTIDETDGSADAHNSLTLGVGLSSADVTVSGDDQGDIVLDFGGGDTIVLQSALKSGNGVSYGVQKVSFDDGTIWSFADLVNKVRSSDNGVSTLYGDATAQAFDGHGSAKEIVGGGGGDNISFNRGYGSLVIDEVDLNSSDQNSLTLGYGLSALDLDVTSNGRGDIILDFGEGDVITIVNGLGSQGGTLFGIQVINFDNGSTWHYSDLLAALETPGSTSNTLYGDAGANTLDGSGIISHLVGGGGGDTFIFNKGYGSLFIDEEDGSQVPNNILEVGANLSSASLVVSANDAGDMILSFGDGDSVTLKGGMLSNDGLAHGVQHVVFSDGSALDYADLLSLAEGVSAGRTTSYGDSGSNTLDGRGIVHTLVGGGGGDTFIFNIGYGSLIIDEIDRGSEPENVLQLGAGLDVGNLTVEGTEGGDLVLDFGAGDRITLQSALQSDGNATYGVQQIKFSDGTSLDYAQLLTLAQTPSSVNTVLFGDHGANVLDGRGIASTLVGGGGGDTFIFDEGYGHVTINEVDVAGGSDNVLQLGGGLTPADLTVSADSNGALILDFARGDIVTLNGALKSTSDAINGVQNLIFSDGTAISYNQLLVLADTGSATNLTLYGDGNGDTFNPLGFSRDIVSLGGGDVINYDIGGGALVIDEQDTSGAAENVLHFGEGVSKSSLSVWADSTGSLILSLGGSDQITLMHALNSPSDGSVQYGIQRVEFSDGSALTYSELLNMADIASQGSFTLFGDANSQNFDSRGIAHAIVGGGGQDSITYKRGYGALSIDETDTTGVSEAILNFSPEIDVSQVGISSNQNGDLIISLGGSDQIVLKKQLISGESISFGVSQVKFANGITWSSTDLASYDSGEINSISGSFNETVDEGRSPGASALPVVDFSAIPNDVNVAMGDDLNSVTLTSSQGQTLTIQDIYVSVIESQAVIRFSDGNTWTMSDLLGHVPGLSAITGEIEGSSADETYDFANVPSNDQRAKFVSGGGGNDVFIYNLGDGPAEILEQDEDINKISTLQFGVGIAYSSLSAHWDDITGNLVLTFGGDSVDSVTIDAVVSSATNISQDSSQSIDSAILRGVQNFQFSDGTIYSLNQIVSLADVGSPQNAGYLFGNSGANVIDPDGYSHYVIGGGGGDSIIYGQGYGNLYVYERDVSGNPDNRLVLGAGISAANVRVMAIQDPETLANRFDTLALVIAGQGTISLAGALADGADGVQSVQFADGTIWTYAQMVSMLTSQPSAQSAWPYYGKAVLVGGATADMLDTRGSSRYVEGNGGGDTIVYDRGYGALTIDEIDTTKAVNTLAFGAGISASDVTATLLGDDRFQLSLGNGDIVSFQGSAGTQVTGSLQGTAETYTDAYTGVEQISFQDGTIWNVAKLKQQLTGVLDNSDGSGVFDTQGIEHAVSGGGSHDRITYNLGYGALEITEDESGIDDPENSIEFGPGITQSSISVAVINGSDLQIIVGGSDIITISQALYGQTIQRFEFSDGTALTFSQMMALVNVPSQSNTILYGDSQGEALDPLGVANEIDGFGPDSIRYNKGYGALYVDESGTASLHLGFGLNPSVLSISNLGSDIVLSFGGSDQIKIADEANYAGIAEIYFGNGIVWNYATLMANVQKSIPDGLVTQPGGTVSLNVVADDYPFDAPNYLGGTFAFSDINANNAGNYEVHAISVTATGDTEGLDQSGLLDDITFSLSYPDSGGGGSVDWSFGYRNEYGIDPIFAYLAPDQSVTLTYNVQIGDPLGHTSTEQVSVTVSGGSAPPILNNNGEFDFINEGNVFLTPIGSTNVVTSSINFTNPWESASYSINVNSVTSSSSISDVLSNAELLAMFSIGGISDNSGIQQLSWNFSALNASFGYLSGSDFVQLDYNISITNDRGMSVSDDINIWISGAQGNGVATSPIVGSSGATITGGNSPALLDGFAGNETVQAGSAGDTLIGGAGDILYGGAGADTFAFYSNFGHETLYGFDAAGPQSDTLQFNQNVFADWAHLLGATAQQGSDLLISLDSNNSLLLKDVSLASFSSVNANFIGGTASSSPPSGPSI